MTARPPEERPVRTIVTAAALMAAGVGCAPSGGAAGDVPAMPVPPLIVDGAFSDWRGVPAASGGTQDAPSAGSRFGGLWVTHDEHYLIMRFNVGTELNLQDQNEITVYLDTDVDSLTGRRIHGIGAELEWTFGTGTGVVYAHDHDRAVEHQDIGVITAPTVTASEFEIAFERAARPIRGASLFPSDSVRIVFADGRSHGDVFPDAPGGVPYSFRAPPRTPVQPIALAKHDPSHLRVLSYNVNNRMFRPARKQAYERILGAIQPDLLVFQEVRDHSSDDVANFATPMLGPPPAGTWHHAKIGGEATVVLSPVPIVAAFPLGESGAFVLDFRARYGAMLLLVTLSAPCCDRNVARQREMDLIMSFVRDAQTAGGLLDLDRGTPIVLIGDANLVGDARQRETLLTGTIVNDDEFGPGGAPDWDGTSLVDLVPRHTHRPLTFTWNGRRFSPGRLDYVIYSDAALEIGNRFVLFTPHMPPAALMRYGLEAGDTQVATNHLPVVADLAFRPVR